MELTWRNYISKFDLGIDVDSMQKEILMLKDTLKLESENESFFHYIKNKIGGELNSLGEEWTDVFAWLKIVKKGNHDWFMYDFEEYEDYLMWKELRISILSQMSSLGIRLVNLFEINCANFVAESQFIRANDLREYYMAECDFEKIIFVTNGKIMKFLDINYLDFESMDFITFYKTMFQKGYKMVPLGQSIPEYLKRES